MPDLLHDKGLVKWLWRHKIPIFIVQVIACAAAIVFSSSYFIAPQFKSRAVIYPYNLSIYSRESSTEQMLQFLNSVDIKNEMIKEFGLINHYKIDTTQKFWYSDLLDRYDKNVDVTSTEFEAVQITVYDTQPEKAYKMVLGILDILNHKLLSTQKEKSEETANMLKWQLNMKKREVDSLSAIAKQLSVQYGLLDYGNQTREVTRAYYQMLASSKGGKPVEEAATQIKNLEEKGQQFKEVDTHLNSAINDYDGILIKYQDALREVNKKLTYSNLVETPFPADRKSYPIRWIIAVITCFGAFILTVSILGFIEGVKE